MFEPNSGEEGVLRMRNGHSANYFPGQTFSLHRGDRSRAPLLRVVPDDSLPLYRVGWPDTGTSPAANLTRCKAAALEWAERCVMTDDRKANAARRLKSLNNFSWSASPMRLNGGEHGATTPALKINGGAS